MNLFNKKTLSLMALMSSAYLMGMDRKPTTFKPYIHPDISFEIARPLHPDISFEITPHAANVVMHQAAEATNTNANNNNNNVDLTSTAQPVTYLHKDISFLTPSLQDLPAPQGQGLYPSPAYILAGTINAPAAQPLHPDISFETATPVQAFVQNPSGVAAANPNVTVAQLVAASTAKQSQDNK
jgi:hypothetical protein